MAKARMPLHAGQRIGGFVKQGLALFPRDIDPTTPPKRRGDLLLRHTNAPLHIDAVVKNLGLDKTTERNVSSGVDKRLRQSATEIQFRKEMQDYLKGLGGLEQAQRRAVFQRSLAFWRKKKERVSPLRKAETSLVLEKAGKYDHINFKPPESVVAAATRGLELRKKASPSNRGGLTAAEAGKQGIGSGVQRAANLKNRTTMSPKTVRMMNRFFARHEKNKAINPENRGTPWNDKGYVAWLLWGGDAGQAWARKLVRQMDAADSIKKAVPKLPHKLTQRGKGDPILQTMGDSKRALPAGAVRVHFSQDRGGFVRAMKMSDGTWKILGKIHKDHEPTGKTAKKTPHLHTHHEHHESPLPGKEPVHDKKGKMAKSLLLMRC